MFINRLRLVAQMVGFTLITLLVLYGVISMINRADSAWGAAAGSSSGAATDAAAPAVPEAAVQQSSAVSATVPTVLNYQGTLRDAEGNPLSGYHNITFRIYDDVTAPIADAIWMEEHISVTVRSGHFSVLLGNMNPIPPAYFTDSDRFIGVMVAPYDEMVPRQRFASVPYAMYADYAHDADSVDGYGAEAFATAGHDHNALNAADGTPTDAVYVDANGNVGVGTRAPQAIMHVIGQENDGQNAAFKVQSGPGTLLVDGDEIDSTGALYLNKNKSGNVVIADGGGRVGIDIANPAGKLDVNGDLNVRGDILNFSTSGPHLLDSVNGNNPSPKNLGSTDQQMCFLNKAGFSNLDGGSETGFCEVYASGGNWFLKANTTPGDDNDAYCRAMCLRW